MFFLNIRVSHRATDVQDLRTSRLLHPLFSQREMPWFYLLILLLLFTAATVTHSDTVLLYIYYQTSPTLPPFFYFHLGNSSLAFFLSVE